MVVWGGAKTLSVLPRRWWLEPVYVPLLEGALLKRLFWQQVLLPRRARRSGCDALFSPGGTLPVCSALPTFTMSQNLLPFEPEEAARYGMVSPLRLKMAILRRAQSRSVAGANGVIFLTHYARRTVLAALGRPPRSTDIIPHGVDERFFGEPKPPASPSAFSPSSPFRILYVSAVQPYKHQWHVARAVGSLRKAGMPIEIRFVGPAEPSALVRLRKTLSEVDPAGSFAHYEGAVPFEKVHEAYRQADAFAFASSCENLPNILLEAMAAGLPIASSDKGPMPEVLGSAGVYFDPEDPANIARSLRTLFEQPELRSTLAREAYDRAQNYSWERCAKETFSYLAEETRRSLGGNT